MMFIVGIIVGIAVLAVLAWLRSKNIALKWYEWLIGILGLLALAFTVQNFFASFIELEPDAAWMFLLLTGLPAIILLVVAWRLIARRTDSAA
jgi:hypothetical protein